MSINRTQARKVKAPWVKVNKGAVYAYTAADMVQADRELTVMKKQAARGRVVNEKCAGLRPTHEMHRVHFYNALVAGERPDKDEGYLKDMAKRGLVAEIPIVTGAITARPLTEQGRRNFEEIFGEKLPAYPLAEVAR
jgi:hypothetical protein